MSGTANAPPALTVAANGVGDISDAYLNTVVQGGCLLADLRNFVGLSQMTVWMIGYTSPGDGGQGMFYWNSSATTPDDGGATTIAPYGQLTGRWLRNSVVITAGPITQSLTGQYYQNQGASIDRLADRVLVGQAVVNNGNAAPGTPTDWLDTYQEEIGLAPVTISQLASLQDSPGQIGVLGGARSINFTNPGQSTIGVAGYAYNNNASLLTGGWSFYGESYRWTTATSNSYGAEIAVIQQTGASVLQTPYTGTPGGTFGLQLDSGNGFNTTIQPGLVSASAAMLIVQNTTDNSAPFLKGIIALTNSIADNGTGVHEVMALPSGYGIQWYSAGGNPISSISSDGTSGASSASLLFQNGGLEVLGGTTGAPVAVFTPVSGSVNYVYMQGNTTGNGPQVSAAGADANVNLVLAAQGAGLIFVATSVLPNLDNAYALGGSGNRYTEVWAVNGTIQTSDASLKTDIQPLASGMDIIRSLSPVSFRWKSGGRKPVERQIEVDEPVFENHNTVTHQILTQGDGTRRVVENSTPARRRVYDEVPVLDARGKPVMDTVPFHRHGSAETTRQVPRTMKVARTQKVKKTTVDWVDTPGKRTHLGFLASDLKNAAPSGMDWGAYVRAEDGTEHIRPDQLHAVTVRALQELDARLAAVEAR